MNNRGTNPDPFFVSVLLDTLLLYRLWNHPCRYIVTARSIGREAIGAARSVWGHHFHSVRAIRFLSLVPFNADSTCADNSL